MEGKSSSSAADDHYHDRDDHYDRFKWKPNWDKLDFLVAVAKVELIMFNKEKKERKRQNLSTFLEPLDDQGTENSITKSNGFVKLELPLDQYTVVTKGKRSLRKKRVWPTDSSKKIFQAPHFDQETLPGHNLFCNGTIIRKPFKRLRCIAENSDQGEEQMPQQKNQKKANKSVGGPSALRPMCSIPERFKNRISELGGSAESLVFVFEKELTKTDVNPDEQRLLIPFKQLKAEFLTDKERRCFEEYPSKKFEIDAIMIDPSLDDCRINLRKWNMRKTSYYALVTHWSKIVQKNQLRMGNKLQLWAFRKNSELGFALVLVD